MTQLSLVGNFDPLRLGSGAPTAIARRACDAGSLCEASSTLFCSRVSSPGAAGCRPTAVLAGPRVGLLGAAALQSSAASRASILRNRTLLGRIPPGRASRGPGWGLVRSSLDAESLHRDRDSAAADSSLTPGADLPKAAAEPLLDDASSPRPNRPSDGVAGAVGPATPLQSTASGGSPVASTRQAPAETEAPSPDAARPEGDKDSNLPFVGLFLSLLHAIQSTKVFQIIANWPAWQQRKYLKQLQEQADADPKDAAKQAEYLRALNVASPQAVVERFERREHACDEQTVVEYLRALVATNMISEYLPDDGKGRASALPFLLQELKQRSLGGSAELAAAPGITEQQPLHVVMVEGKARSVSSKGLRILQEIVGTVFIFILFSVFWVLAATALRRYVAGVTSTAIGGAAPGGGVGAAAGVYAPKEYSKETMPEKSVKTFKDVKGCDEAKAELEEIVEYLRNPAKFTRLGGKLPKGVLLVGPPGTGKTLLAKAIAGEAGVPFFYRAGSEFEEMFVGVGARRVRALFQAAKKKAPCIVFIDEIDAVGASRKQWEGHTKKTLNQLLVEMDGFEANEGIIVIAATNLPEMLDPALTRPGRFDRHVVVPNPDIRGRKEILDLYLSDKPRDENVDSSVLARGTPGFSGADLANLVNMAAVKAALEGNERISNVQLEFAKDKILMGSERKSMAVSKECRRNTAYHESGHALVAMLTEGAMPIHKATIMPRGMALGMVTQLPDDDYENSRTRQQMMARMDVCMGGRVAEEMIFGADNVTSGARDDLRQATKVARHMVLECGFSESLGPVFIDPEGSSKFSSETMRKSDAEVVKLLRDAYDRVKKLLKKHEADLHKLAAALQEKETLTAEDIKQLLGTEAAASQPTTPLIPQGIPNLLPTPAAMAVPPQHLAGASSKKA